MQPQHAFPQQQGGMAMQGGQAPMPAPAAAPAAPATLTFTIQPQHADLPGSSMQSLSFIPGSLPPLMEGEKRVCGVTLHPVSGLAGLRCVCVTVCVCVCV